MPVAMDKRLMLSEQDLRAIFEEIFRKSGSMYEVTSYFNERFNQKYNHQIIMKYIRRVFSKDERKEITRKMHYNIDSKMNQEYIGWCKNTIETYKRLNISTDEFVDKLDMFKPYDNV